MYPVGTMASAKTLDKVAMRGPVCGPQHLRKRNKQTWWCVTVSTVSARGSQGLAGQSGQNGKLQVQRDLISKKEEKEGGKVETKLRKVSQRQHLASTCTNIDKHPTYITYLHTHTHSAFLHCIEYLNTGASLRLHRTDQEVSD